MHRSINRRSFLKVASVSAVFPAGIAAAADDPATDHPVIQGETHITSPRERFSLDFGWRFALGNAADPEKDFGFTQDLGFVNAYQTGDPGPHQPAFVDAAWRVIDVPHDWVSELGYDQKARSSHGCRPVGRPYPENSIGWYRKSFELAAAPEGRRVHLQFEGVFRDASVWVNGTYFTRNESGYSPFEIDVTSVAHFGATNVVVVRVDATASEGWFYEGAGIYRHVWLTLTDPVHIAPWGVFVTAEPETGRAKVLVQARVLNKNVTPQSFRVLSSVYDPEGTQVATSRSKEMPIDVLGESMVTLAMTVSDPQLWDLRNPHLYRLETLIEQNGAVIDNETTRFGIRSIRFDADKGFFLNGEHVLIKGTCNHQDHAGVGVAVPDRLFAWRLAQLRAMGCNAVRCAHHQQAPAFLDACDRMGFLVMDEHRMPGAGPEVLRQLETQVRCDRNHPSIILYSLGNEENGVQNSVQGKRIAETMRAVIRTLDTTRPTTYAGNNGNAYAGINAVVDVRGWNYTPGKPMDDYHAAHPSQPNVASEQEGNEWWPYVTTHPFMSGGFVWSGFAYHGEANWPDVSSLYGLLDLCGYPREDFFAYQSWWREDPVLHLSAPPDDASGKAGTADFTIYSNCEEIELFLESASLGRRKSPPFEPLRWTVASPVNGKVSASGYRGGKSVVEAHHQSGGVPAAIRLTADRMTLDADRRDIAVVTVEILDSNRRIVRTATNPLAFALDGPGQLIGVGNGDPACHEPENCRSRVDTLPLTQWRFRAVEPSAASAIPPSVAADFDDSAWAAMELTMIVAPDAIRTADATGVYRTAFDLPVALKPDQKARIVIGAAVGESNVYVNGVLASQSVALGRRLITDIGSNLHAGRNTVVVVVRNSGKTGGIGRGVSVAIETPALPWRRSAFEGRAQVLVQVWDVAGTITLRATSAGLGDGTIVLTTVLPRGGSGAVLLPTSRS